MNLWPPTMTLSELTLLSEQFLQEVRGLRNTPLEKEHLFCWVLKTPPPTPGVGEHLLQRARWISGCIAGVPSTVWLAWPSRKATVVDPAKQQWQPVLHLSAPTCGSQKILMTPFIMIMLKRMFTCGVRLALQVSDYWFDRWIYRKTCWMCLLFMSFWIVAAVNNW